MNSERTDKPTIGLALTSLDAHTLGVSILSELLTDSDYRVVTTTKDVRQAFDNPQKLNNSSLIEKWIRDNDINILGFSYRLEPNDAVDTFGRLMYQLYDKKLFEEDSGPLSRVYFSGLPKASDRISRMYKDHAGVFYGDETPLETFEKLGLDTKNAPKDFMNTHPYDDMLLDFGSYITKNGDYKSVRPIRRTYPEFGTKKDGVVSRISDNRKKNFPPVMRAHAGPYNSNRKEAVREFIQWSKNLSESGLLDVLSIGASQLSQEMFGEEWLGRPNGGGVPVNSPEEYKSIEMAARPMLVRTYAGTKNRRKLAEMYEDTMNIAWHALPFWWFSKLDGRGPYDVLKNLEDNFDALDFAASSGKPVEPNVPHHFSFRGSDDTTYAVSAYITAKACKEHGVKDFILQTMHNNPKYTWGVNDISKARSALQLVKTLEDKDFRVYLQTRAGLDYLSHDLDKAKAQLAGVTALMDDIEPLNSYSPDIVHVVSYSEGQSLATPDVINESVQISRYALDLYRNLRKKGDVPDMTENKDVLGRTEYLTENAQEVIKAIEGSIKDPYSPEGFYTVLKEGFLPAPQLMYLRDEFPDAVKWKTQIRNGSVDVYTNDRILIPPHERLAMMNYR